jgi:hypothetical protein
LYSSAKSDHIKENVVGEARSMYGEKINANGFFFAGKLEGKRPLGRLRRRWEDNINKNLKNSDRAWTRFIWLSIGTTVGLL